MSDDVLNAQQGVVDMRRRVLAGEDVPPEELALAVARVRESREAELTKPKPKRGAKNATTKSD